LNHLEIIEKKRRLLQILGAYIEGGDMKAIELYSKILTELRNDLKCGEEDDGIPDVFEDFIIDRSRQAYLLDLHKLGMYTFILISDYIRNDDVELFERIIKGKAKADDFDYTQFAEQNNGREIREAISAGMRRYHERRRRERIESGDLCGRDKYRIAIIELSKKGMSYEEITGKVVVEYINKHLDGGIEYTYNRGREISRMKRKLLGNN